MTKSTATKILSHWENKRNLQDVGTNGSNQRRISFEALFRKYPAILRWIFLMPQLILNDKYNSFKLIAV